MVPKTFSTIREQISDDLNLYGGGIDPVTGYSRRVMVTMPWVDFTRPVPLNKLPDWQTFIAGLDSPLKPARPVLAKLENKSEHKSAHDLSGDNKISIYILLGSYGCYYWVSIMVYNSSFGFIP